MNIGNLEKYIKALESGIYTQCKKAYGKADGSFCALGVGLDVMAQEGLGYWDSSIDEDLFRYQSFEGGKFNQEELLRKWLGLRESLSFIIYMNDEEDKDLAEIATTLKTMFLEEENNESSNST